jgi:hypothetical protein
MAYGTAGEEIVADAKAQYVDMIVRITDGRGEFRPGFGTLIDPRWP